MAEKACFCGSGKSFDSCCEPIILNKLQAQTAEELMRSRYSAYCMHNSSYLMQSAAASQRANYSEKEILEWAVANKWQKLEVLASKSEENRGEVEFKAYYIDADGTTQIHHEKSQFIKELGKWYYLSGKINPKSTSKNPDRNDPCPCGSGKKYKKCCGK